MLSNEENEEKDLLLHPIDLRGEGKWQGRRSRMRTPHGGSGDSWGARGPNNPRRRGLDTKWLLSDNDLPLPLEWH